MDVREFRQVASLLWRFLNIYFLKPFDAVNDTATAALLHRLGIPDEYVEIGSGDGMYSYVMNGGSFPLWFDRYLQTDLSQSDIYDVHRPDSFPNLNPPTSPHIALAIDSRQSHAQKLREIGHADLAVRAAYEALPLPDSSVPAIFIYTPHGLESYESAIREAHRALQPNGTLLALVYDQTFRDGFLCYRLANATRGKVREYFLGLDNGRYLELSQIAKSPAQWTDFFRNAGFSVDDQAHGLGPVAWKFYDIQTRPILKSLIRSFSILHPCLRTPVKLVWMLTWYPILLIAYLLFANHFVTLQARNCYMSLRLRKLV